MKVFGESNLNNGMNCLRIDSRREIKTLANKNDEAVFRVTSDKKSVVRIFHVLVA